MIRTTVFGILLFLSSFLAIAQNENKSIVINDTFEVKRLLQESKNNFSEDPQNIINFAEQALILADSLQFKPGIALALKNIGIGYYFLTKHIEALEYWQKSLKTYKLLADEIGESNISE